MSLYAQMSHDDTVINGDQVDGWNVTNGNENVDWDALATSAAINLSEFPAALSMDPVRGHDPAGGGVG